MLLAILLSLSGLAVGVAAGSAARTAEIQARTAARAAAAVPVAPTILAKLSDAKVAALIEVLQRKTLLPADRKDLSNAPSAELELQIGWLAAAETAPADLRTFRMAAMELLEVVRSNRDDGRSARMIQALHKHRQPRAAVDLRAPGAP